MFTVNRREVSIVHVADHAGQMLCGNVALSVQALIVPTAVRSSEQPQTIIGFAPKYAMTLLVRVELRNDAGYAGEISLPIVATTAVTSNAQENAVSSAEETVHA